jgi:hypothetical protein
MELILARTTDEKLHFQTIESALNKLNITIRTIQHSNALYICSLDDWKQKVNNFMEQTGGFSFIGDMTSNMSNNHVQDVLINMNNQITNTLHNLYHCKAITTEQYEQIMHKNQLTMINVIKFDFVAEMRNVSITIQI